MSIEEIIELLQEAYEEDLRLSVTYTNSIGETSEYEIWEIDPECDYGNGEIDEDGYIQAYCGSKDNEECDQYYTFKISRFNYVEIVP